MAPGCSICQEPFQEEDDGLECISTCGHVYHALCLQQWLEMCPRNQHCPLCRTSCSQRQAVINIYLTHFGKEAPPAPAGKKGEDGDGTAEAKFTQDKTLTLTLENQRLELLLAAAKSAAKGNAEALEAMEGRLQDAENKLRGEKVQMGIMVAAHNAAQAELRQRASFLQILNDDFQKRVAALEETRDKLERRNKELEDIASATKLKESANITKEELDAICISMESGGDIRTVVAALQNSLLERNAQFRELTAKISKIGYEKMMAENTLNSTIERNEKLKDKLRKTLAARCSQCKGSHGPKQQQKQIPQHQQHQDAAAEGGAIPRKQGREAQQGVRPTGKAPESTSHGTREHSGRGKTGINQTASQEDDDLVMLGPGTEDKASLRGEALASESMAQTDSGTPDELLSEGLQPWPAQTGHAKKRVRADQQPQGGLCQEGDEPDAGRRKSPQAGAGPAATSSVPEESLRAGAGSLPRGTAQGEPAKMNPLGQPASRGSRASWGADLDEDLDMGVRVHARPRQESRGAFISGGSVSGSPSESPFDNDLPLGGSPVTPILEAPSVPGTMGTDLVFGRSSVSSLGRPSMWSSLGGTLETGTVASVRVSSRSTAHLAVEQAKKQAQRRREEAAAQAPLNPFNILSRAQPGAAREPSLGATRGAPTSTSRGTLPRDSVDSETDPFDLPTFDWSHDELGPEPPLRGSPGPGHIRNEASNTLTFRTGSGGLGSAGVGHGPERPARGVSSSCAGGMRESGQATSKVKPQAQKKQLGAKKVASNPLKPSTSASIDRFFQRKQA